MIHFILYILLKGVLLKFIISVSNKPHPEDCQGNSVNQHFLKNFAISFLKKSYGKHLANYKESICR